MADAQLFTGRKLNNVAAEGIEPIVLGGQGVAIPLPLGEQGEIFLIGGSVVFPVEVQLTLQSSSVARPATRRQMRSAQCVECPHDAAVSAPRIRCLTGSAYSHLSSQFAS
ncbi:hypothetical protein DQP56_01085 [Mycolicibacter senuensis]|nr:hypothetical protein DQP56_01085 [Mycolicibacter senuensis]